MDALVNAIATATATGAELVLEPGEHLTKPGRNNRFETSGHGPSIRSQDPDSRATIKRPDSSIVLANPDDNHGLFFVPSGPPSDNDRLVIARVKKRGIWWFTPGSLGDRDIDVALPLGSNDQEIHRQVSWWPFPL
ncbi:hypothetical protein EV644_12177 [Kribbella orskensis]|uniref:Uncharacterized protein n=1 Tax=Kribbella orskensis TaxID=2512216 RepID=A0ABY2BBH3_9ACTN|nr:MULTISPECIES: hypothetical protein [Kribbella]TCN33596.1 hypothetical protein EV642_12355 [Kribbella sp. VKM Ac-2500]TCO13997.1 hypothetical protein EV644_12177 [Kribbella orskensis]